MQKSLGDIEESDNINWSEFDLGDPFQGLSCTSTIVVGLCTEYRSADGESRLGRFGSYTDASCG